MLDLHGMSDELAVLSGSTDNIAIWEEVWHEYGPNLDVAMQIFHERRKGKKSGAATDRGVQS
jgi:type IV secretion system protein VirB4